MKIGLNAHLHSQQAGYRSAGIKGYITNLLRHLPACAPDCWQFEALVGSENSAQFERVKMSRSALDTRSPLRRIVWEQTLQPLSLRQFDLYHALAFVAPIVLTAPMLVTVYDLSFLRFPERLSPARRLYLRHMTALTCWRARRVLAISQSTADDLVDLLGVPTDKIDVTPLGYDKAVFRRLPAAELERFRHRHDLPERFWLYVGTLEPRKNLSTLLAAYQRLSKTDRLPLILGGGIGWRGQAILDEANQLGLGDSVTHIGFIPAADLPFWYNCADAFVYPSVFEGFGLPVLEAMACGTPVLTSDAAALTEVAGSTGKRIAADDVEAWADALKHVKTDETWRESARTSGLERARQFSWERTAELTIGSYRRALAASDMPQPLGGSGSDRLAHAESTRSSADTHGGLKNSKCETVAGVESKWSA